MRRIVLLAALLCPVFSGCDWLYGLLDKEGAEEKKLVGEVASYEKNPTVEEVQVLLGLYGYNPGRPDGILGLRTRNAIEKFQEENGLKKTRFVDEETWKKIKKFKNNGLIRENYLNVGKIQQLLQEAGFSPGKADGKLGTKTKDAVKDFQKAHGLKVDGKIGYQTLSALEQYMLPAKQDASPEE